MAGCELSLSQLYQHTWQRGCLGIADIAMGALKGSTLMSNSWFGGWAPYHLKQNINPLDIFWNPSGQYGMVNITMKSSDPATERDIVENVASYGKQLGRMADALLVLLDRLPTHELRAEEQAAIDGFREMAVHIMLLKDSRSVPTDAQLGHILDGIDYLKRHNPQAHQRIAARLRAVLATDGEGRA